MPYAYRKLCPSGFEYECNCSEDSYNHAVHLNLSQYHTKKRTLVIALLRDGK